MLPSRIPLHGPPAGGLCLAYLTTMAAGSFHRPAIETAAVDAPRSMRDWALPTRQMRPDAPSTPTASALLRTMAR